MRPITLLAVALVLAATTGEAVSQNQSRPVPYPVFETPQFQRAVEAGTRSRDGNPGSQYWMNEARYDMDVTLTPESRSLDGTSTIVYKNNSPDHLYRIVVNLYQNLYKKGETRNRNVVPNDGMNLSCALVDGSPIVEALTPREPGYVYYGTKAIIVLPEPVTPGGSVELRFCWDFEVPDPENRIRMGTDGEVFFLGYWYPQVAVYDDVTSVPNQYSGWDFDRYMGDGEFYMDYADYDVRITVPNGWLVPATGTLENADEILSQEARDLLKQAEYSPDVVHVVTDSTRDGALLTNPAGLATWHFKAENVRDFAFAASDRYVWDATYALVGDSAGYGGSDRAMIYAFYRSDAASWARSAEFAKFSIEHMSRQIMPYPWPHMTTVEGIIRGGMEYPMMTLIGGNRPERALFGVTYHELAHMWFPMIVGQNEKAYTWMDEGLTSFNTNEGHFDFWPDTTVWDPDRQAYFGIAGSGLEVESMRHADQYPYGTNARGMASYGKPALMLHTLRGLVGNDRFYEAYREYARRWAFKHPTPYDLFNTFEDVLGTDLDWFWRPAFYETWTLDQEILAVDSEETGITVTIRDNGLTPLPAPVVVTYAD
ncbi:M1 family metallopeptidase [Bacteroidota bacterium]